MSKKVLLFIFGACFAVLVSFHGSVSAEEDFVSNEYVDADVDEVNIKLMELDEKIRNLLGPNGSVGSIGYIRVDKNGVIQLNLKKNIKSIYNEKSLNDFLSWAEKEDIKIENSLVYSSEELTEIQDEVFKEIKQYYNNQIPTDLNFSISQDDIKQNINLKLDLSRKEVLEEKLLQKLKKDYPDVLEISKETYIAIPETYKSKRSNWNKLGGGLGLTIQPGVDQCTTTAMLHKDSRYFLLTAGHCFEGEISSTGGAYIRQYNTIVGRQHTRGNGSSIDGGLIRMEGNTLSGGRYATNGVKISDDTSTSETFDNKFVSWSEVPSVVELNSICKSGIKTNKTCGKINGPIETKNFGSAGLFESCKNNFICYSY